MTIPYFYGNNGRLDSSTNCLLVCLDFILNGCSRCLVMKPWTTLLYIDHLATYVYICFLKIWQNDKFVNKDCKPRAPAVLCKLCKPAAELLVDPFLSESEMTFGRFSFRAQTLKTKERREKIKNPCVSVSMCGIPWQTYQLSRCIVETCRRANTLSLRRRSTSVGIWNYTSCSMDVKMSQELPSSLLTFKILSEALDIKTTSRSL